MIRYIGGILILTGLALLSTASAGEIERGIGSCNLGTSFRGCEWKPVDCYKPSKPFLYASDVQGYNFAVDQFNNYLAQVKTYKECVIADGKEDIEKRFQSIVVKGATDSIEEINDEVSDARRSLEMARPLGR